MAGRSRRPGGNPGRSRAGVAGRTLLVRRGVAALILVAALFGVAALIWVALFGVAALVLVAALFGVAAALVRLTRWRRVSGLGRVAAAFRRISAARVRPPGEPLRGSSCGRA
ncbi:prion 2 domain protein [Mycobacterium kansasii]|uniref:Prion 2 domain protein n=1 Tax=Mycobacterium kansasii TaxID=1768 RepID=A0A1V3XBN0_MYCKA|nr:prion 2 domain protein [Mycobacterium kansasii]